MSDAGRKDFSSKAQEAVTPQSSKSTTDKISESVTNTTDQAARAVQGDSSKSTGQSVADKAGAEKDSQSGGSATDTIKNTLGLNKS